MHAQPGTPAAWDGALNARRLAGDVWRMGRSEQIGRAHV